MDFLKNFLSKTGIKIGWTWHIGWTGYENKKENKVMMQNIRSENKIDENGNPTGGSVQGVGIDIRWQDGPLGRGENRQSPNGAFVEGVILAAIQRLEFFQGSKFKCRENALAITKLEEALHWLNWRTLKREDSGTEGTHNI